GIWPGTLSASPQPRLLLAGFEQAEGFFELLPRRCQILQELHVEIEMNEEREVPVFAQDLLEKAVAGAAFIRQNTPRAAAGVDQEAERQRKIALSRKIADGLRLAFFVEQKIVLAEAAHHLALLIPHSSENVDDLDIGGEGGGRLLAPQQPGRVQQR